MIFNSIDFAIFLPVVFTCYWFLKNNITAQNIFIALSSYFFYGWWDCRFLFLIVVGYVVGIVLKSKTLKQKRNIFLYISMSVNLGLLGFSQYHNFFILSFVSAFSFFSSTIELNSLNIFIPVGISFYTFQTLSYSIDLFKGKIQPTTGFIVSAPVVSLFSQWVAERIERASHLLSHFFKKRQFNDSNALFALHSKFDKVIVKHMNELCQPVIQLILCNESWSFTDYSFWNFFGREQVAIQNNQRFFINQKY